MTLADTILKNALNPKYPKAKVKRLSVRIPRLKIRRKKPAEKKPVFDIHLLLRSLINKRLEEAKSEKSEQAEDKSYNIIEEQPETSSGYGTISKNYGTLANAKYTDYEKIFSYLGRLKTKNAYENAENPDGIGGLVSAQKEFYLVDKEVMDKGARYVKYMLPKTVDFINAVSTSLVPIISGMNSKEWEELKMWIMLDPVMYGLKIRTS